MAEARLKPLLRVVGLLAGGILIVWAVVAALREIDLSQVSAAHTPHLLLLALAVAVNLVLTGVLFWLVTLSFDADPRVPPGRMIELIAASSLLNYLPLRAGLLGRASYLKLRHGLPLAQSGVILLVILGLGAGVLMFVGVAVMAAPAAARHWACLCAMAALLLASPLVAPVARRALGRTIHGGAWWVPLRVADMMVGGARLWLAFAVIGAPVPIAHAIAMSAAGMLVSLVGLTPNGLGMREWVVAAAAGVLSPASTAAGLAASLIDRAVEAVVLAVAGTWAIVRLRK